MNRLPGRWCVRTAIVVGVFVLAAQAEADVVLDTSFGVNGVTRTVFGSSGDEPRDLLIQPDGKILTAGLSWGNSGETYVAISRHSADGEPDSTFGVDGKVLQRFVFRDHANAIALQGDGKIVAAGMRMTDTGVSTQKCSLYRFLADGAVDTTFGPGGTVFSHWLASTEYGAVKARADESILAAGRCNPNFYGGVHGSIAGRFLPDGTQAMGSVLEYIRPIQRGSGAFQDDGKILYANIGPAYEGGPSEFQMTRVDSTGAADGGFGTGGLVRTGVEAVMWPNLRVQIVPDGKILLVGTSPADGSGNFTALRFLSNGTPDSLFGVNGRTDVSLGPSRDQCFDAAVDGEGRILLAGEGNGQPALCRLLPDGGLDSTFSGDGKYTVNLNGGCGTHYFTRVLILPDGKILAAGFDYCSSGGDFFLARFWPSDVTGVDDAEVWPTHLMLHASPNPSHAGTTILLQLSDEQAVRMMIFDVAGREVRHVFDGSLPPGTHEFPWDGRDASGDETAAGAYFAKVSSSGQKQVVKLVRIR